MTQTTIPPMDLDTQRLEEFVGQFAADLGAVLHCATVLIGDRVGLYRAMADCRWLTAEELAVRTGRTSATSVNGWPPRPPPGTRSTTRRPDSSG